ncbi:MAG: hypothetical protein HW374_290 [Bacteroidetes bacterium]|nr:hypothetical protein [Bacteroidota bacterium]
MPTIRDYYQYNRKEMLQFLPETYSRVLEIGCGEGNFLMQLRGANESWGVEPDKNSAEIASQKLTKVFAARYDQIAEEIPNDYFDLIICNDVIEHMNDHDWFFDSIRTKLRNSGSLVASLPNVRYVRNLFELLVLKDWRYQDSGILDRTHLRFFTKKSILRTLNEHGLLVEEIRGIKWGNSLLNRIVFGTISILSLGFYSDVQYPQFGIRMRKRQSH